MARVAPVIPAESDLLCEGCGYILTGLAETANCPECGRPIAQSVGAHRAIPPWEGGRKSAVAFVQTTLGTLLKPTAFFRTIVTRGPLYEPRRFAHVHWILSSILFALALVGHLATVGGSKILTDETESALPVVIPALVAAIFGMLAGTTWLAARLTCWEAAYRGIRLPRPVVLRGMYYHAAHYTPVALIALVLVFGFRAWALPDRLTVTWLNYYMYALCSAVVLSALYLFRTYWIAMRNMMYANR
jgi:hypothetical protein